MAIMAGGILRKPRLLIAAGVICALLLLGHIFDGPRRTQEYLSDLDLPYVVWDKNSASTDKRPSPHAPSKSPSEVNMNIHVGNVHRIKDADDFWNHFGQVFNMPPMSVPEARATCLWNEDDKVNFMFGQDIEWNNIDKSDLEINQRREEWRDFVRSGMIKWSKVKEQYAGKGIVVVAGNFDSKMRVRVMLRQLVAMGSELPVEIHYWDDEIQQKHIDELNQIHPNLYFNDLSLKDNVFRIRREPFKLPNYQFKTAAILNSRFAEVMLFDADNIPVIKPEELFNSETYKEYGTVFWPDIARTRPNNPAWAITNTACKMNEYEQESGQLMVDKRRFFYHLQLSSWMITAQHHYYSQFILGDKDCFRFAWHALKTIYGRPTRFITSVGTNHGGKFCGHTFGQAYPDKGGPLAFLHGGLMKGVDMQVLRWNREQPGGYFNAYKRAPEDERPEVLVNVGIMYEEGKSYMPAEAAKGIKHGESCTDFFDVEARPLSELLPGFSERFEDIGGYWQLEKGYIPPLDSADREPWMDGMEEGMPGVSS